MLTTFFKRPNAIRTYATRVATVAEALEGKNTNVSELKNGFRVATHGNGRPTATFGVWIDSGSRYENSENNGVAYFLEHMIYKGTKSRDKKKLETDLAKIGAKLDSYTSREHTAYVIQCPSNEVNKAFEILADVMRNSKLDKEAVEVERKILLKKLEEFESNSREVTFDNLHKTAFQGTPMMLSPHGHTKSLDSITSDDIHHFMEDTYKANRMVVSAVGGVSQDQMVGLTERFFGDLDNAYKRKIPTTTGVRFTGSEIRYRDDYYPYMYVAMAVEGVHRGSKDYLPLEIAKTFVGQWDRTHAVSTNSPLKHVQEINQAHELQLYDTFNLSYKDTGLWGTYMVLTGTSYPDVLETVPRIMRVWKHLCTGVTDEEISRVKNMYTTNLFTSLETNAGLAEYIAKEVISTGKSTPLHVVANKIIHMDAATVREAMSRHIYDRDLAIAATGRTEAWLDYNWTRSMMSWWKL